MWKKFIPLWVLAFVLLVASAEALDAEASQVPLLALTNAHVSAFYSVDTGGRYVNHIYRGSWVRFDNVNLRSGVVHVDMNFAFPNRVQGVYWLVTFQRDDERVALRFTGDVGPYNDPGWGFANDNPTAVPLPVPPRYHNVLTGPGWQIQMNFVDRRSGLFNFFSLSLFSDEAAVAAALPCTLATVRIYSTALGGYNIGNAIRRNVWNRVEDQPVTLTTIRADGTVELDDREIQIRGRGHSSWGMAKRPFRIRFTGEAGEREHYMLGSDHAARHWTFIANHADKTLLRNYAAYYLSSMLDGMSVAPHHELVNVYFNGFYQGVYLISHQVNEMAEGRVNLQSANPVRTGPHRNDPPEMHEFLLERCARFWEAMEYAGDPLRYYVGVQVPGGGYIKDICTFEIRVPNNSDFELGNAAHRAHATYVQAFMANISALMSARDPRIFNYICLDAFVDFYIVQELFKNLDMEASSFHMQIRGFGDERRLEPGPVWDFDIAAGNADHQDRPGHFGGYGPTGAYIRNRLWYMDLFYLEAFRQALLPRWDEAYAYQIPRMIARIEYMAYTHRDAIDRNFERWPIFGTRQFATPPSARTRLSYDAHLEYLLDWLRTRATWIDQHIMEEIRNDL